MNRYCKACEKPLKQRMIKGSMRWVCTRVTCKRYMKG